MSNYHLSPEQEDELMSEIMGDGYSNEYARCSAESLMFHPIENERDRMLELIREGKFVVMSAYPHYCRITSGIIGEGYSIQGIFDTEAEAVKKFGAQINPVNIEDHDPDVTYSIESQEKFDREDSEARALLLYWAEKAKNERDPNHPEYCPF